METHRLRVVHAAVVVASIGLGSLLALGCGGGSGEVGEACDTPGSTDECADGAVCDSDEANNVVCLALCTEQEDCGPDEDCNGVSGSNLKACHPKDAK